MQPARVHVPVHVLLFALAIRSAQRLVRSMLVVGVALVTLAGVELTALWLFPSRGLYSPVRRLAPRHSG